MTDNTLRELEAMKQVAEALKGLEDDAIRRVLVWASDHFGIKIGIAKNMANNQDIKTESISEQSVGGNIDDYTDLAELFAVAQPKTDADKALVVSYWKQFKEGNTAIDSQSVNTSLKHMGYGVGNITRAFENLKKTKPVLMIQLQKSGTSIQARKTYKVTTEGKKYVENLLQDTA